MDLRFTAWTRDGSPARFAAVRRSHRAKGRDEYVEAVRQTQRGRKRRVLCRLIDRETVSRH